MCERQRKIEGLIWRWKCSNTTAMCASINMYSKCTQMWWLRVVGWYSDNETNKVSRSMGGCVVGKVGFFELPKRKMLNIVKIEESVVMLMCIEKCISLTLLFSFFLTWDPDMSAAYLLTLQTCLHIDSYNETNVAYCCCSLHVLMCGY